jgi:diaminopimelate decarboxylase
MGNRPYRLMLEPGRSMVGNAGVLLTQVEYVKPTPEHHFVIVDAAMNDLLRPALYDAWHDIRPVRRTSTQERLCQIVGPVCESGDFLGHDRMLGVHPGDLLAVMSAGAYGMSMSSNYNARPRAAEVMIDREHVHLIRARENIDELFAHESFLPE